jgi:hypothetical protein
VTFLRFLASNQKAPCPGLISSFYQDQENSCAAPEVACLAAMIRIPRPVAVFLLPFALLIAGCGGFAAGSSNADFHVNPAIPNLDTNTQQTFAATMNTGGRADVNWRTANGDIKAGAGTIAQNGLYTPPAFLTQDVVQVRLIASLKNNPASNVAVTLILHPGFLQPLSPENATLSLGSTIDIQGTLAEVSGGAIHWALSTTPTGGGEGAALGTLGPTNCQRGRREYTTCKVTYKAPSTLSANSSVYVVARANDSQSTTPLHILLNGENLNSSPLVNQEAQKGLVQMGSSGGNNNDYDTLKDGRGITNISNCCGGTLGALVEDSSGSRYILSNNHVLAESDQARKGDSIIQPGLIDGGCTPYGEEGATIRPVATLSAFAPLASRQSNVDAAIARIDTNVIDGTGAILHTGPQQSGGLSALPPAAGTGEPISANSFAAAPLRVVKSGRTTGLTCSTIESISQNVLVDYFKDCAETTNYLRKVYTNQISIGGNNFTDAGDSGALIMDASNAQPLGLFYASGSGVSLASPIGDVLNELATQTGQPSGSFKVVGGAPHSITCLDYETTIGNAHVEIELSAASLASAQQAASLAASSLVNSKRGVLGTAVGKSADNPGEAAVVVYVDEDRQNVTVPATIGRVRTLVIPSNAGSVANHTAPISRTVPPGLHLPASVLAPAIAVKERNWRSLMSDPAIFGVGVAQSQDNPAEAALLVYVDRKTSPASMPATIEGLRVRYLKMDRFHVTRSKSIGQPHPSSCTIQSKFSPQEPDFLHNTTTIP